MSSSLLSFVLLCIVFVHSVTAQDLESSKKYYKADSGLDSKESEYEMRSILNGYKNKDYKKNDGDDKNDKNGKDLYEKEYFNDPYKREYFNNDPYKREYFNNDPYKREYRADPYAREY